MITGPNNNLAINYLTSIYSGLQNTSSASSTTTTTQSDAGQLSPFAQIFSQLQQLQQNDPAKYSQVTQEISTNLANAAQTAQANGDTTAASRLLQLSSDFSKASQTGQMPDFQNGAQNGMQATGGHHRHHHAHPAADPDGDSSTSSSTNNTDPFLAAFQNNTSQNNAYDPFAIIANTLQQNS